jgi:Zn-dependent peptidase ImmA (M78 family)/transcriptional regulator with XRE-family HTH domain
MAEDVTAARVRALIESSGLTQADFAAKAGLDASKISKSLKGVRRFTSLDLARIAELGGVSVDWLLGVEGAPAVAARALGAEPSAVEVAVREATRFAQARADLAFLGYPRPPRPAPVVPTDGSLVEQGIRLAEAAVAGLRGAGGEPLAHDLAPVVEEHFGVDLAVVEMPDGCDGLAWSDEHAHLILVGTTEYPTRQRFTIAHELGHLLAADDQGLHMDEDVMDPDRRRQPSETRANAFAAAFLLPADDLREAVGSEGRSLTVDAFAALVLRFMVSPSTLAYRLDSLGLISAEQREEFRELTTAVCAARTGATGRFAEWIESSRQSRLPSALVRDTFTAYVEGRSTLRPFANLVGLDVESLRRALDASAEPAAGGDEPEFAP